MMKDQHITTEKNYFDDSLLPNYESQCSALGLVLVGTMIFWVVIFPYAIGRLFFSGQNQMGKKATATKNPKTVTSVVAANGGNGSTRSSNGSSSSSSSTTTKQRRGKTKKGVVEKKQQQQPATTTTPSPPPTTQDEPPSVPLSVLAISALGCMISLFYEVMTLSPYNTFVARGVFEVPLFTAGECEQLVNISMRVAQQNYESALHEQGVANITENGSTLNRTMQGLLWEPVGWQKLRHQNYPTTDLNIITDPFTKNDLDWLQTKLDARLAPTLSKIYGIPESAIRANDMFVVRYDSDYRAHLSNHTDDADISINVLLTDNFEGGGTQFWNRQISQPFAHVQPKQIGQMLTHSALINHEGMQTTKGTRIIFVGFLSVDRIFPFEGGPTGLTTYASWLSLPWLSTKFKEAYVSAHFRIENKQDKWSNNKYVVALFLDLANVMQIIGDYFATHHVLQNLVQQQHKDAHLQALDETYQAKQQQQQQQQQAKASWFAGQQIDLDIDGTITQEWSTRQNSKNRFMEL